MGYEDQLTRLKQGLEKAQRLRADAETKESFYKEQRDRVLARLKELGVEPEDLDQEINRLKAEMDRLLAEANGLIPWELLEQRK